MRLVVPGEEDGCEDVGTSGKVYMVRSPRSPWIDGRYRLLMPLGRGQREIARILRAEQPDILEVADKYSLPYVSGMIRKRMIKGFQRPTEIATSHERISDNVAAHLHGGRLGKAFSRLYMRWIYFAQFDHHVANSLYTAAELIPASVGHTTRRGIWICPMGVDTDVFTPRGGTREQAATTDREGPRLLYAGRLAREKNIGILLDALELLPQSYTLDILGDGPERQWFAAEAAHRLAGRVGMHGYIADRNEYLAHLWSADAFVHPNPREPFGIGPLEAMAAGIPVVAPNSGGVLSYANDDNAWLYRASPQDLAHAVLSVFVDKAQTRLKVCRARRTAEQYDWSAVAERYFKLLDTLHQQGWAADGLLSPRA